MLLQKLVVLVEIDDVGVGGEVHEGVLGEKVLLLLLGDFVVVLDVGGALVRVLLLGFL